MKKHLIFLWLSATPICVLAESPETTDAKPVVDSVVLSGTCPTDSLRTSEPEAKSFVSAEIMPSFQGGNLMKFRSWVMQRLRYPRYAQKNYIEGPVLIKFVVNREGQVSNIEALSSPHESLTEEVIRVIRMSPKWTPGEQGGKKVNVHYIVPINFSL